jgi:hypothetical protein
MVVEALEVVLACAVLASRTHLRPAPRSTVAAGLRSGPAAR